MAIARFVVDTNVFLHCLDLLELKWADVSEEEEIELYVANTVTMEIDKFKGDGNARRARRARALSARIGELVGQDSAGLDLRASSPRLTLLLAPALDDADEARILSHALNDYRIVEEGLLIAKQIGQLALLTNDTLALRRANARGLTAVRVPDTWLLPPEKSDIEKRLATLERVVKEREAPVLAAEFSAPDHADWRFDRLIYDAPPAKVVDGLTEVFTQQELRQAQGAVDRIQRAFLSPITLKRPEDHVAEVREWREKVREWFANLPDHCHMASRLQQLTLKIANTGGGPAEHVRIVVSARGSAVLAASTASLYYWNADEQFLADARRGPPHLTIPECPPDEPEWMADASNWRDDLRPRAARDRYAFHRTSRDDPDHTAGEVVFECDDFRHGGGEVYLHFAVFAGGGHPTGQVRAIVTASNAGEPVEAVCEFTSEKRAGDVEEVAKAMAKLRISGSELNKAPR